MAASAHHATDKERHVAEIAEIKRLLQKFNSLCHSTDGNPSELAVRLRKDLPDRSYKHESVDEKLKETLVGLSMKLSLANVTLSEREVCPFFRTIGFV